MFVSRIKWEYKALWQQKGLNEWQIFYYYYYCIPIKLNWRREKRGKHPVGSSGWTACLQTYAPQQSVPSAQDQALSGCGGNQGSPGLTWTLPNASGVSQVGGAMNHHGMQKWAEVVREAFQEEVALIQNCPFKIGRIHIAQPQETPFTLCSMSYNTATPILVKMANTYLPHARHCPMCLTNIISSFVPHNNLTRWLLL